MWSRLRTLPTPISTAVRSLPRTAFSRVLHLSHVHRPRVRSTLVWRSCESLAHLPELGVRVSLAPARRARVARPCSACACRSPQLGVRVSLASALRARVARLSSACACRSRKVGVRVFLGFVHPVCRVCGLPETYKRDTPALLLLWRRCQTLRLLPTHLLVSSVLAWRPADSVM